MIGMTVPPIAIQRVVQRDDVIASFWKSAW